MRDYDFAEHSPAVPYDACKETILHGFFNFPFFSDQVYQRGLSDLVARDVFSGKTNAEKAEIIVQTRLFYFNRVTGQNLTAEDIRSYQDSAEINTCHASLNYEFETVSPSRSLSFVELKTLIEQGKIDSIPNNKVIPNMVNDVAPSTSVALVRKKPWEGIHINHSEGGKFAY